MMQEKELFQESFSKTDNWILIINFVKVDFRVLIKNNKNKLLWRRAWQPTPVFLLENPMDREAWWFTVHGVIKTRTRLSD